MMFIRPIQTVRVRPLAMTIKRVDPRPEPAKLPDFFTVLERARETRQEVTR